MERLCSWNRRFGGAPQRGFSARVKWRTAPIVWIEMIKLISERDLELGHVAAAAFDSLLKAASNEIAQSNARLFARVPEPGNLQDGVTYDVDLKRGWFEHSNPSGVVTFGPAHPIGTFLPRPTHRTKARFSGRGTTQASPSTLLLPSETPCRASRTCRL